MQMIIMNINEPPSIYAEPDHTARLTDTGHAVEGKISLNSYLRIITQLSTKQRSLLGTVCQGRELEDFQVLFE